MPAREQDGHLRLVVGGQCLLRRDAVLPQAGQGGRARLVVGIEVGEQPPGGLVDEGDHGLVEVDPAEPLDADRAPDELHRAGALGEHGRLEGAAAEVVDRERRAGVEPVDRQVLVSRGLGVGHGHRVLEAGRHGDVLEEPAAVRAPAGGVGQHDPPRRQATDRLDAGQDVAQDRGQQVARGLGVLAEQHRGRITEPAADEPGGVGGVGRGAAGGELPGDEGVGVAAVDDGGDGGRPVPEGDHLDAAVLVGDRRGHGGPPEVDPEDMGHGALSLRTRAHAS